MNVKTFGLQNTLAPLLGIASLIKGPQPITLPDPFGGDPRNPSGGPRPGKDPRPGNPWVPDEDPNEPRMTNIKSCSDDTANSSINNSL